jgi:hypothetical protein
MSAVRESGYCRGWCGLAFWRDRLFDGFCEECYSWLMAHPEDRKKLARVDVGKAEETP